MQIDGLKRLIEVASGRRKADLVVKDVEIVNVLTEEFIKADIAVCGDRIAGIGSYEGIKEIDGKNLYAVPGLIDGHTHLEMSMLSVTEFARLIVPRGNTTVIADPHEIANVLGREGIKALIEESKTTPLRVFFEVPSCVPSSPLETPGAVLNPEDIAEILTWDRVIGLAEVMNYPGVVNCDENVLEKVLTAKRMGKVVDGHCPMLRGRDLNAYVSAGIFSDHEITDEEEALEKLRLGMRVMIREGSVARNLKALLNIAKKGYRWCMLVTDGDRTVRDLIEEGYLDHVYRRAVEEGVDPIKALQMCTINPAEYFNIDAGLIAPGRFADIVLLKDLERFDVKRVIANGEVVGNIVKRYTYPDFVKKSVRLRHRITPDDLKIEGKGVARIIRVIEGEIVTAEDREYVEGVDVERDVLKIVVVERHKQTGNVGKAYIRGFGLKRGAFASSISHDAHNIVAVGVSDEEICKAINRIADLNGGIVVVDGEVKAELSLEIAGLMSEEKAEVVMEKLDKIHSEIKKLGCKLRSPILALSFMALPVIPKLKVTDLGLLDVEEFRVVDVFVS